MVYRSHVIAINLRFFRLKRGITQLDLAKLAGIGKTAVKEIETLQANPTKNTLIKLADALNVQFKDICEPGRIILPGDEGQLASLRIDSPLNAIGIRDVKTDTVYYASPKFKDLFDIAPEDLEGKNINDVVSPTTALDLANRATRLQQGYSYERACSLFGPSGPPRPALARVFPVFTEDGRFVATFAVFNRDWSVDEAASQLLRLVNNRLYPGVF